MGSQAEKPSPDVARLLADYLRNAAREPFQWGVRDCGLFLADWVSIARGIDPAARLRGTYSDDEGAVRAMGKRGLPGIVMALARDAGLRRTQSPSPGTVAVLRGEKSAVCAIYTARGWAVRDAKSIIVVPPGPHIVCAFEV